MLNCALATVLLPVIGIMMLIKRDSILTVMSLLFPAFRGGEAVVFAAMGCLFASMNLISTPSVALEGSSLWVIKSLPVESKLVLYAKAALHVLLTAPAALIYSLCIVFSFDLGAAGTAAVVILPLVTTVLTAALGLMIGLHKPNLSWTREVVPIKQSVNVIVSMFSGMGLVALFALPYFLIGTLDGGVYLLSVSAVYAVLSYLVIKWLSGPGAAKFEQL